VLLGVNAIFTFVLSNSFVINLVSLPTYTARNFIFLRVLRAKYYSGDEVKERIGRGGSCAETRNTFKILVRNSKEMSPHGRTKHRCDYIKTHLTGTG